jgi:hypothetical protein
MHATHAVPNLGSNAAVSLVPILDEHSRASAATSPTYLYCILSTQSLSGARRNFSFLALKGSQLEHNEISKS